MSFRSYWNAHDLTVNDHAARLEKKIRMVFRNTLAAEMRRGMNVKEAESIILHTLTMEVALAICGWRAKRVERPRSSSESTKRGAR